MNKYIITFLSIFLLLITFILVIIRMYYYTIFSGWETAICLFIVLIILFFYKFFKNHYTRILLLFFLLIVLLSMVITLLYNSLISQKTYIVLNATGDNNVESNGSEIWITSLIIDNITYDLSKYESSDWIILEDSLFSNNGTTTIILNHYKTLQMNFVAHPWSGIIEITTPSETIQYDLYRNFEEEQEFIINIPFSPIISYPIELNFVYILSLMLSISIIIKMQYFEKLLCIIKRYKLIIILFSVIVSFFLVINRLQYIYEFKFYDWLIGIFLLIEWFYILFTLIWKKMITKINILKIFGLISISILLTFPYRYILQQNTYIEITATGDKNVNSNGNEVWVGAFIVDTVPYDLRQYISDQEDDNPTILLDTNTTIRIDLYGYNDLTIIFVAHPWSGIVKLTTPAGFEYYDLYRVYGDDSEFILTIPFISKPEFVNPWVLDFIYVLMTILLFAIIFNGEYIINRNKIYLYKPRLKQYFYNLTIPILYPTLYIFYFYRINQSYLSYTHIIYFSLIVITISIIVFIFNTKLYDLYTSTLIIFFFWTFFFTFKALFDYLSPNWNIYIFLLIVIYLFSLSYPISHMISSILKKYKIFTFISITLFIIFLMNFIPVTYNYLLYGNITTVRYKTDFIVDSTLPKPNIYWFYMDGMMGFSSVERVFGDSQDNFYNTLIFKGFQINKDAYFEAAHETKYALPALLSPQYYDNILENLFNEDDFETVNSLDEYTKIVNSTGLKNMDNELLQVRLNYELFKAFQDAAYSTILINISPGYYFSPIMTRYYNITDGIKNIPLSAKKNDLLISAQTADKLYSLNDLFSKMTITFFYKDSIDLLITNWIDKYWIQSQINTNVDVENLNVLNNDIIKTTIESLFDSFNTPSPHLTLIGCFIAHRPFIYNENGIIINNNIAGNDINNYMPTHRYAVKMLLQMINMILENDNKAVIIIQSDHGIHHEIGSEKMINTWGFTLQQTRDVWNGVISAVLIPELYGGLDKPLDPLNITRELVNRFVGSNYDLLLPDQPNQRKPELTDIEWANWSYNNMMNSK